MLIREREPISTAMAVSAANRLISAACASAGTCAGRGMALIFWPRCDLGAEPGLLDVYRSPRVPPGKDLLEDASFA